MDTVAMSLLTTKRMDVLKFQSPTSIAIFAPSFSGKSMLTRRILENADTICVEHSQFVVYCYKEWLPMFVDMKDSVKEYDFTSRYPIKRADGRMDPRKTFYPGPG